MDFLDLARPEDLVALQWFIITALIAVVVYLWRENKRCVTKNRELLVDFLTKVLSGLSESNQVTESLASALEEYQTQLGILRELDNLKRLVQDGVTKKD